MPFQAYNGPKSLPDYRPKGCIAYTLISWHIYGLGIETMYNITSLHFTSGIVLGSSVYDEIVYGSKLSPVDVTLHSYRF